MEHGAATGEGDTTDLPMTYRTSALQRGLSLLSMAALLLLAGLEVTDEGPLLELTFVNLMLTAGFLAATASYGLRATIHLSEDSIRLARPLWTDTVLRFEEIRKASLPVTTEALWLYRDADAGGGPDLAIEALSFERFEDLVLRVVKRLPSGAAIQDPADRIDQYRRECGGGGADNGDGGRAGDD